ncbi:hypothetical protein KR044_006549 [Drosophila immigrans]|nr:hypothetical protein KR044_006549 [Drosophila immigrans]
MEDEADIEFQRGLLTRKMEAGEYVVMETDQAAVLRNVSLPKARHHFVVLPKEDIANVTALSNKHLPLLDHMRDLAIQTIEQQTKLPLSNFLMGFKMEPFMNRLNMHVISNDFCADTMKRIQHWNTFNTELFIKLQAVFALLKLNRSIEPMSQETAESLRNSLPVRCNQCTFKTSNFPKFKDHLEIHWKRQENNRIYQTELSKLMANMNVNGNRNFQRPCPNVARGPQSSYARHPRPGPRSAPPTGETHLAHPKPYKKFYNKKKTNS